MGKVIYEEQSGKQIPPSMVIHQSDDAWHPLKDRYYIEWWYFDLVANDGCLLRGQLFIAGDVSRPNRVTTGVRASYMKTEGTETRIERRFWLICDCGAPHHRLKVKILRGDINWNSAWWRRRCESPDRRAAPHAFCF